jgi:PHP family Zn ribbon phosphoesterase
MALIKGLDFISITDHNSHLNVKTAINSSHNTSILVVPGVEIQSIEDIHILCYFESYELLNSFMIEFLKFYPTIKRKNNFGNQLIYNLNDEVSKNLEYSLMFSSSLGVEKLKDLCDKFDGAFIPAHINKGSYSLLSSLGFIPETLKIKTIEYFKNGKEFDLSKYLNIYNSDSHSLGDISESDYYIDLEEKSIRALLDRLKNGL